MSATEIALLVVAVLFVASFVRAAFGFGEALIAVPLLSLALPIKVAAPLAVLVSITVAAVVLVSDWRHVQVRSAGWLLGATAVGTPLGLLALNVLPETMVKLALGLIIVGFSLHALRRRRRRDRAALSHDRRAWIFGLGAGILGGAYGMNGPPLVMYGTLRGWSARHFRATLQGYFLPASALALAGYGFAGLWTPAVTRHYLMALPAVLLAIVLGRRFGERLGEVRFLRCVHLGLIVVGGTLLLQALT